MVEDAFNFEKWWHLDPNWSASIDNNDFSVGLSIVFLKFESWVNSSSIEVNIHKVFYDSWAESRNETIFPNIHLPTENNETFFHPSSIIKSFSSVKTMKLNYNVLKILCYRKIQCNILKAWVQKLPWKTGMWGTNYILLWLLIKLEEDRQV